MRVILSAFALCAASCAFANETKAAPKKAAAEAKGSAHALAPEVTLDELKGLVESKSGTIVDANTDKMYAEGHIPGAVSYAAHKKDLTKALPADKNTAIVAYCGGTMCTAWEAAAKDLKKLGYTNVKHFKGGISGWKAAGLPTETVAKAH